MRISPKQLKSPARTKGEAPLNGLDIALLLSENLQLTKKKSRSNVYGPRPCRMGGSRGLSVDCQLFYSMALV